MSTSVHSFSPAVGRALFIGLCVSTALAASTLLGPRQAHADHEPLHGTVYARAPFAQGTDLSFTSTLGGAERTAEVTDAAETIMQQIVIQPGGFTGWHTHPGPAVVIVAEGVLSLYQGDDETCTAEAYGPGEAFIDPGQGNIHGARNDGAAAVDLWVTFFDVPPGEGPSIMEDDPGHCVFDEAASPIATAAPATGVPDTAAAEPPLGVISAVALSLLLASAVAGWTPLANAVRRRPA